MKYSEKLLTLFWYPNRLFISVCNLVYCVSEEISYFQQLFFLGARIVKSAEITLKEMKKGK